MNKRWNFKMVSALVVVVIGVSVASSLVTNYFVSQSAISTVADRPATDAIPTQYTRFANTTSGVETDFTVAADLSVHAVVHIKTKGTPKNSYGGSGSPFNDPFFEYFFGPQQQQNKQPSATEKQVPLGAGSGVIISKDGYIVTNNHVIEGATEIEVTLNDKRTFIAKLIGTDPSTDIALIKIEGDNYPYIVMGNSDEMKVGEWVLAVGNPFNLTSTVTAGIVSAKARNINIIDAEMKIESFIQTDAAINPGNSGGALVNTKGELIGVNTAIASRTGSYAGYGFAVPTSIVKKVVSDLRKHGVIQRALLGVRMGDITTELSDEKGLKTMTGAYIDSVVEGSAADIAGVKEGDVIVAVDSAPISSSAQLQEAIGQHSPNDKVDIKINRKGKILIVKAKLQSLTDGQTGVADKSLAALGAEFKPASKKTLRSLGLHYGLSVSSLTKGKFYAQGIKPSFIIYKINNKKVANVKDLKRIYDEALTKEDKVLYIAGVYPNGKVSYYAVNLAH